MEAPARGAGCARKGNIVQEDSALNKPEPAIDRAVDWLNAKLYPYIGPADLGPFETITDLMESSHPCPICAHPMMDHPSEFDPETGHHFLHHPDPAFPDVMEIG